MRKMFTILLADKNIKNLKNLENYLLLVKQQLKQLYPHMML